MIYLNPSKRKSSRKNPYGKLKKCPKCGSMSIARLGGSWTTLGSYFGFRSPKGITIRVEFCLDCPFVRKLYRIFPENSEKDWKPFI